MSAWFSTQYRLCCILPGVPDGDAWEMNVILLVFRTNKSMRLAFILAYFWLTVVWFHRRAFYMYFNDVKDIFNLYSTTNAESYPYQIKSHYSQQCQFVLNCVDAYLINSNLHVTLVNNTEKRYDAVQDVSLYLACILISGMLWFSIP